jgi:sugar transferase (PEP-CTERM/EpsH1 system associated)
MAAKKLLWVKTDAMLPLDKGGKIRSFNMLRHIAGKAAVDYVCFASEALGRDDRERLTRMLHAFHEVPPADPERMNWKYLANLVLAHALGRPFTLYNYHRKQMAGKIEELCRSNSYDAIVCDFLGPALNFTPAARRKAVLFQHNVEHVLWARQAQQEKRPWRKLVYAREYRLVKRYEEALCRDFRRVICVSSEDAEVLRSRFGLTDVYSVDTGVDIDYFTPSAAAPIRHRIVFTGSMDWLPNIDAMNWFVAEIFPKVKEAIPAVELAIVGRNPGPEILRLAGKDPGIIVSGKVPDVRPWMAEGEVFIVPIRVGGGTRLKIYEAMAMGLPVISTTIGAEGLEYAHGENILIADRAEDFATALVGLLQDPERRRGIGRAARDFVVENYSWPRIADQFLQIVLANEINGLEQKGT